MFLIIQKVISILFQPSVSEKGNWVMNMTKTDFNNMNRKFPQLWRYRIFRSGEIYNPSFRVDLKNETGF